MASAYQFTFPRDMSPDDRLAYGIGRLVMEWANAETVFFGIFECLAGRDKTDNGEVIWLSLRTTEARMALITQLAKVQRCKPVSAAEIATLCGHFKGVTRSRNFYCHAQYEVGDDDSVSAVINKHLVPSDDPLATVRKKINRGTLNEIAHAIREARRVCVAAWRLMVRLRTALSAEHVELPEWLPAYLAQYPEDPETHPVPDAASRRGKPPAS